MSTYVRASLLSMVFVAASIWNAHYVLDLSCRTALCVRNVEMYSIARAFGTCTGLVVRAGGVRVRASTRPEAQQQQHHHQQQQQQYAITRLSRPSFRSAFYFFPLRSSSRYCEHGHNGRLAKKTRTKT